VPGSPEVWHRFPQLTNDSCQLNDALSKVVVTFDLDLRKRSLAADTLGKYAPRQLLRYTNPGYEIPIV
jgi:hypothetical protein